jgi:hypothetical protein
MKTLEQSFCEAHRCEPRQFRRRLFRQALYPHARLFAPLLGGFNSAYFTADRELIAAAAQASTMRQLREEVRYFRGSADLRRWPRGVARLRISTKQLIRLGRAHLSEPAASPAPPMTGKEIADSDVTDPVHA